MKRIYILAVLTFTASQSLADGPYDGIYSFNGYVKGQEFQNGIQYVLDPSKVFFMVEESDSEVLVTLLNPKLDSWQAYYGERVDEEIDLAPVYDMTDYLNSNIGLRIDLEFLDSASGFLAYTVVADPDSVLSSGDVVIVFDPIPFEKVSF